MASCRGAAGQKEAHVPRDLRKRVQKYHRDAVAEGAGAPQRRVPGRRSGGCRAAAAEGARRCGGGGRQRPWWRSVAAVVVVGGGRGGGRRRPWWRSAAAVVAVGDGRGGGRWRPWWRSAAMDSVESDRPVQQDALRGERRRPPPVTASRPLSTGVADEVKVRVDVRMQEACPTTELHVGSAHARSQGLRG